MASGTSKLTRQYDLKIIFHLPGWDEWITAGNYGTGPLNDRTVVGLSTTVPDPLAGENCNLTSPTDPNYSPCWINYWGDYSGGWVQNSEDPDILEQPRDFVFGTESTSSYIVKGVFIQSAPYVWHHFTLRYVLVADVKPYTYIDPGDIPIITSRNLMVWYTLK